MISIIVCNRDKNRLLPLIKNINSHIGNLQFEIIVIDNSNMKYSIFEAYNEGVRKSRFDYLLFIHDDVLFHDVNFGEILLKLDLPNLGVLGIAGSKVKTKIPTPWWISNFHEVSGNHLFQSNIQHYASQFSQKISIGFSSPNQIEQVLVVDGVCLFTKKENCKSYPFDEKTFDSFHFYDLDYSLGMLSLNKSNYVTNAILIEHFSAGSLNSDWVNSAMLFFKKWNNCNSIKVLNSKSKELNEIALASWVRTVLDSKGFIYLLYSIHNLRVYGLSVIYFIINYYSNKLKLIIQKLKNE